MKLNITVKEGIFYIDDFQEMKIEDGFLKLINPKMKEITRKEFWILVGNIQYIEVLE